MRVMRESVRDYSLPDMPLAWSRKAYDRAERARKRHASAGFFSSAGAAESSPFKPTSGGGGITAPTFVAAGTGSDVNGAPGDMSPTYPAGIAAGDFFLAVVVGYLSGHTAPSGWTTIYGPDTFSSQNSFVVAKNARASGSESGSVTFNVDAGNRGNARIYAFRGCAGTGASDPFEAHATASGSGAVNNPTVTPTAAGRLGVLCAMGFSTGASVTVGGTPSGGTWVERAEYDGSVDIFFHELQTVDLTAGGAISGGTTTAAGSNQTFIHGFALIGV